MSLENPGGSQFTGPLRVKDSNGNILSLDSATVVDSVGATDGAADAVPTSAQAFLPVTVNGVEYVISLFKKA